MATYRHWSASLWRDPDDVPHCRILCPDKTEWRLISAMLCGWRHCFVADQLWFVTCVREEEEDPLVPYWSPPKHLAKEAKVDLEVLPMSFSHKMHQNTPFPGHKFRLRLLGDTPSPHLTSSVRSAAYLNLHVFKLAKNQLHGFHNNSIDLTYPSSEFLGWVRTTCYWHSSIRVAKRV